MTREEKVELIKLSDLNREDNIKYISSEAQGIAITLDSDRYAPTFCKLERAYICGRRKSEKEIEELKLKLEAFEGQTPWKDIKDKSEVIGKLTKATEIIRELLCLFPDFQAKSLGDLHILNALAKAKQFIKEIEE